MGLDLEPFVAAGRLEEGRVLGQKALRDGELGGVLGLVFVENDDEFFSEVGDAGDVVSKSRFLKMERNTY